LHAALPNDRRLPTDLAAGPRLARHGRPPRFCCHGGNLMSAPGKGWQAAVLSGGAAYAAYEVGVLKALAQGERSFTGYRRVEFQVLDGTSAGSVNAAVRASRPGESSALTAAYLEQVWLERVAAGPGACGSGAIRYRGNLARLFNPACYAGNPARPLAELAA